MIVILGDINGDGKIDGIDYILMKLYENGLISLSGNSLLAATDTKNVEMSSEKIKNHIYGKEALTEYIITKE